MTDGEAQFPEYGDGGDHVGARRVRRAFRLCVVVCVLFTGMLWFSEYFLRYEGPERLYIAALTHEPESGRVLLQAAIKTDVETRETPTPKYVAALAEREARDDVLATYENAYRLDPNDPMLAIRYGCRLFVHGKFKEARERFREANAQPLRNALPGYLEAAALQWATPDGDDIAGSLALVARTNSGGEKVVFPRPAWAPSALPQGGAWYTKLRRQALDECCAPLYRYADFVIGRATEDITAGQVQYWDPWLRTLQEMGERLMGGPDLSAIPAIAGIQIQLSVITQRNRIREANSGAPSSALLERAVELQTALERLTAFERARDDRIAQDREGCVFPLALALGSALGLGGVFVAVYLVAKFTRVGRKSWTISHLRSAKVVLLGGCAFFFALLCTVGMLQRHGALGGDWKAWLTYPWVGVLAGLVVFGGIYPSLRLAGPRKAAHAAGQAGPLPAARQVDLLPAARRSRRVAGVSLMRRYYGILLGLFLCAMAAWVVVFRVFVSLYPWQVKLLTTGLAQEEAELVREVLAFLHAVSHS